MESSSSFSAALLLFLMAALVAGSGSHPAAAADDDGPTSDLMVVKLQGDGNDEAYLAVQRSDLSLAGFATRHEHWYAFPGYGHLLPTSRPLPFRNSYRDLIGGLANLSELPLGQAAAVQATRVLADYEPATAVHGDDEEVVALKWALVTFKVTTCEALRLLSISNILKEGWSAGVRVAAEQLPYIEHWDTMSFEILRANQTGEWKGPFTEMLKERANIHTLEEALAVVDFLINRTVGELMVAHLWENPYVQNVEWI